MLCFNIARIYEAIQYFDWLLRIELFDISYFHSP